MSPTTGTPSEHESPIASGPLESCCRGNRTKGLHPSLRIENALESRLRGYRAAAIRQAFVHIGNQRHPRSWWVYPNVREDLLRYSAEVVITAHHKRTGPCSDRVNVDEQTENLKSAPISICSFCSSCIGASYLPSTTDYEIAIMESRRGGFCYARHIPRARARSPARDCTSLVDRKSTRLNSSHRCISYAVFCLKKKKDKYYKY